MKKTISQYEALVNTLQRKYFEYTNARKDVGDILDSWHALMREIASEGLRAVRSRKVRGTWTVVEKTKGLRNRKVAFKNVNLNPNGKIVGDCTTRAISYATNIPYEEVRREQNTIAWKTGIAWNCNRNYSQILKKSGYKYLIMDKKMTEASVALCLKHIKSPVVLHATRHLSIAHNGEIVDNWDSRGKRVRALYVKKNDVAKVRAVIDSEIDE